MDLGATVRTTIIMDACIHRNSPTDGGRPAEKQIQNLRSRLCPLRQAAPPEAEISQPLLLAKLLFEQSSSTPGNQQLRTEALLKVISDNSTSFPSRPEQSTVISQEFVQVFLIRRASRQLQSREHRFTDMAPFYTYCSEKFQWKVDTAKLQQMSTAAEVALAKIDERRERVPARRRSQQSV